MSKWITDDLNAKLQAADTLKAVADKVRSCTSNFQFVNDDRGLFIGVFIPKTVAGPEADSLLSQRIDDWKQQAGTFPVPPADTKAITDADESAIQAEATAPVDTTSSGNGSDDTITTTAGTDASNDQSN